MQKYYLDTCIWRDFFEDRFGRSGNPLGSHAAKLFFKMISNNDRIIFCKYLIWELSKSLNEREINDMLNLLFHTGTLIRVEMSVKEYDEARKISNDRNLPFVDCLNAIIARDNDAVLVSQDQHFHNFLSDIVKTARPQDII